MQEQQERRVFLKNLAMITGGVVLMPYVISCGSNPPVVDAMPESKVDQETVEKAAIDATEVPLTKPSNWEPISYNTTRGNLGFIPDSYLPDVNGPDGPLKHVGKHLPYVPVDDASMVPAGFLAIMWGDPALGYAKHPNAAKSESNPDGHWYNSIKIRKAVEGETEELMSVYTDWPGSGETDNGAYAVSGGGDITADSGKNTVYLAALPAGLQKGDTIRIWAHCLTHGEYVDFLTI